MMADHLIGPQHVSTPAELKRSRARELPDDLLRAASGRLGVMSLLFAVLWVVGVTAGHLATRALFPDNPRWRQFDIRDAIAAASVVVSLALFAYIRRGDRDPRFVLDLGLWYMVFTAFALSVMFHLGGIPSSGECWNANASAPSSSGPQSPAVPPYATAVTNSLISRV
jgi:hypothetical protein